MPVVIVGRGDICPAAASQGTDEPHGGYEARQLVAGLPRQEIPETDKRKSRPGCNCDEDHKEGTFGVSVANGCRDGWEPLLRVAVELILDDLVVMQGDADNQCTKKGRFPSG